MKNLPFCLGGCLPCKSTVQVLWSNNQPPADHFGLSDGSIMVTTEERDRSKSEVALLF